VTSHNIQRVSVAAIALATASGCIPLAANSPIILDRLQMVSAGHTGCLPSANSISNVKMNLDGSGLWNATCNGRTYLCSAVGSTGGSESFSCAPVAQ
jgi:hypothetical protein